MKASNTMPFTARADLMVRRGEARTFSEACSKLSKRRNNGRTVVKPAADLAAIERPRLPYADNA